MPLQKKKKKKKKRKVHVVTLFQVQPVLQTFDEVHAEVILLQVRERLPRFFRYLISSKLASAAGWMATSSAGDPLAQKAPFIAGVPPRRDPLALPPPALDIERYQFQRSEAFKLRLDCPADPRVTRALRCRVAASDAAGVEVVSECQCGQCRVTCSSGGPLITTVCHCSICRAHDIFAIDSHGSEPKNRSHRRLCGGMPFAAVRRHSCRLEIRTAPGFLGADSQCPPKFAKACTNDRTIPFQWLQSSTLVRRGRCTECKTPLLFDQASVSALKSMCCLSMPGSKLIQTAGLGALRFRFNFWCPVFLRSETETGVV